MSKIASEIMKDVSKLSLQIELQKLAKLDINAIIYGVLSDDQIEILAKKIGLLPSEYRNILFFKYLFSNSPSETENVLGIENSKVKLRYVQKMLSAFMGLENSWIANDSMKKACQIALKEETKEYDNLQILHKPNYSKDFRLKLKNIKIKQNYNQIVMLVAKRAAIFILVTTLSFSAVMAVNAQAREKVLDWIIETFPQFTIFTSQNIDEDNPVELTAFNINYIPRGFELVDTNAGRTKLIYNYSTKNDQKITIIFSLSSEGKSYYDTENAEIEEFVFKGSGAYIWQTSEITYLIWYQDGIECHISGNISKDEIIKVAENILK
ncbi:MAG: DUF4367 domain-containing protein [Gudongella sp.]|nr:DUF4367 domain-containing protein [Gudongella sp.]